MSSLPLGPEVDPLPRPLPARTPITGMYTMLEPLHRRHADELFEAARGADDSFTYMGFGPFATREDMTRMIAHYAAQHDPIFWAVRPIATGVASGVLSLLEIEPANAAIELGQIWFSPRLQRTRAATEAMYLLLKRAADELGYRRLVWKCHALNAPSIRAAQRLGFTAEGVLRAHRVINGRERDTAMFSITEAEWPSRRDAMEAWLSPDNFAHDGTAKRGLASFR